MNIALVKFDQRYLVELEFAICMPDMRINWQSVMEKFDSGIRPRVEMLHLHSNFSN